MPGYLDQYGAGEERREKIILRSVVSVLAVALIAVLGWYLFKNHHQEGVVKAFVSAVRQGDYRRAYRIWGCTDTSPCSAYSFNNFMEDWGPAAKGSAPDTRILRITDAESCNNGVLITVAVNASRKESLWVDKGADSISFAPYPICPFKNPWAVFMHRTVGQLRKPLLK
jgi:hypothetical protein